ncbi:MAG: M20/M25/M40 family metallo-hydrolase [Ilumatobacter sp.]|uniref:peptidase dimerization domain-containing protein n=1 Tax=Ilumatobacter sp. TaxID=1967498 RepID=UPI0026231EA2|nr:peptidase dimerization domain-containing protein [Ilumatobacter sp.]MDJ0767965.1 M20/M25/M40 family metallo-hydrolase [Ilumatobacter sp.]
MSLDEKLDHVLDDRVAELAARYLPLAVEILREAVRIPADQVDRPEDAGGDPAAGLSNHERMRLEMLRDRIIEIGAVRDAADVGFDDFGNLVWVVEDDDGVPSADKKVIYLDGHSDTVQALRDQWHEKLNGAVDPYDGLVDAERLDRDAVRAELGYLPPDDEWEHLLFGRGTADQLAGVISQIIATKILLELAPEGALRGTIVRSYATVAEEDNDGGGPRYVVSKVLPGASPELVPDVVIFTEGTGDNQKGALGIYRGQRGRMQIEVTVTGRSCHGSMPHLGLNPLEFGARILVEATEQAEIDGFADHAFLGAGTRTASWAVLDTPSDCAVPDRFTFRFDRRLTVGETPELALDEVARLDAVTAARDAGLTVDITVPVYEQPTHTGYVLGNDQIYPGWETPEDHPAITAAVEAYRRVVSPRIDEPAGGATAGARRSEPRVDRWVFSTDGVGFPVPADADEIDVPASKAWVTSGDMKHPAMFGIGAGVEQNTHRIGENIDRRELEHAIAVLARFPSLFSAA